jgi:hypothetical protein
LRAKHAEWHQKLRKNYSVLANLLGRFQLALQHGLERSEPQAGQRSVRAG